MQVGQSRRSMVTESFRTLGTSRNWLKSSVRVRSLLQGTRTISAASTKIEDPAAAGSLDLLLRCMHSRLRRFVICRWPKRHPRIKFSCRLLSRMLLRLPQPVRARDDALIAPEINRLPVHSLLHMSTSPGQLPRRIAHADRFFGAVTQIGLHRAHY